MQERVPLQPSSEMDTILHITFILHGLLMAFSLYIEDNQLFSEPFHRRPKRIVNSDPVLQEDQQLYPVTGYQSNIISAHFCSEALVLQLRKSVAHSPGHWDPKVNWKIKADHVRDLIFTHCPMDRTRSYCGGAAITEWAIQTACHCIAFFDVDSRDRYTVEAPHQNQRPPTRVDVAQGFPKAFNAWEDMVFLYVGAVEFNTRNTPYVSKDFSIHEKCQQINNVSISHNLGIITLRYKLAEGTFIAAPMTMQELKKHWYLTIEKEAVCLFIGWGSETWEGKEIYGEPSFNLTKAWRVMRSYTYCYTLHKDLVPIVISINIDKILYKDVQTWSCSTSFGKFASALGHGDAGSPVSCGGLYFGIASWGMVALDELNRVSTITADTDIVYAMYENSWNYRTEFNKHMDDLSKNRPQIPEFKPYPRYRSFDQDEKPDSDMIQSGRLVHSSLPLLVYFIALFCPLS